MTYEKYANYVRWTLLGAGAVALMYALVVLIYVVTTPDIGIRCLLDTMGPQVRTPSGNFPYGPRIEIVRSDPALVRVPRVGDTLLEVAGRSTPTFQHFVRAVVQLRSASIPPGGHVYRDEQLDSNVDLLPPIISKEHREGERWVKVAYQDQESGIVKQCWLPLKRLPGQEIAITFVWFLLQSGIFLVGALATWSRPFDRSARLFFAMCIVTMVAFVGGFHWWVIAGSAWLTVPFAVCALLVPAVILHFFVVYPQPQNWIVRAPVLSKVFLYTAPVIAMCVLVGQVIYSLCLLQLDADPHLVQRILSDVSKTVLSCVALAAAYFLATIAALLNSYRTTRSTQAHNQVKWILGAGLLATIPVGYTLYLAVYHRTAFALGWATPPMFAASFVFMLAYAVGIIRYKLMLVDEILSRGMLHYFFTLAVAAAYGLAIAGSTLVGLPVPGFLSGGTWPVFLAVLVTVLLLGWFRDRLQQMIDRRFFREKYPLDKALTRMSEVGDALEPQALAGRLLAACRDVLGVDRSALYLHDDGKLSLAAAEGIRNAPRQLGAGPQLLEHLQRGLSVHRQRDSETPAHPEVQVVLKQFDAELVHTLEADRRVAGVLLLGARRAGVPYSPEDLAFLTAVGQIACVALASAKVHQAVARLNEELQRKIDKIADQQRMIAMLQGEITSREVLVAPADSAVPAAGETPEHEPVRRGLIKGRGPAMAAVMETVRKVSGSQSSVLIRGESGTGKELLAQAIHKNSPRASAPMISVHCGALSPGLLESELFGHVKGSFTGAHKDRAGRFEMANGGTLFLDEIGDISPETQIKLLRVLQERCFEPVGGSQTVQVDVRLIAATHQNLERLIVEGKFREDLFYRLNVISITLPPLRERRDDLFELTLHFLGEAARRAGKRITHLDDGALQALLAYRWPGNIRELENVIERAVVLADGSSLTVHDLPPEVLVDQNGPTLIQEVKPPRLTGQAAARLASELSDSRPWESASLSSDSEQEMLVNAMQRARGNKAEAARLLGMPRSTFFSKLKKYSML